MSPIVSPLLCLGLFFVVYAAAASYESYTSYELEQLVGLKVLRVDGAVYVTYPDTQEFSSVFDFPFQCEYYYEQLSRYSFGRNYDGVIVPQTTPMFISIDILDLSAPRTVSFILPTENREKPPSPYYPLYFSQKAEEYYFVRPTNETALYEILHDAANLLTDLSYARMPFESTTVMLALYNYPPNQDAAKATEIWVRRSLTPDQYYATT